MTKRTCRFPVGSSNPIKAALGQFTTFPMVQSAGKVILLAAIAVCLCAAQAPHQVTLTWTWAQGSGPAATNFVVQRSTVSGGPYVTIASPAFVLSPAQTYGFADVSGSGNVLAEGQKYCYVVAAQGASGTSANSGEACGIIPFALSVPGSLGAVAK